MFNLRNSKFEYGNMYVIIGLCYHFNGYRVLINYLESILSIFQTFLKVKDRSFHYEKYYIFVYSLCTHLRC